MGYEIVYFYHEKMEDGSYNKDETKELKRKLGEPFEDVPIEKLATAIMQQLARRDIWVQPNVDIFEYKKQKISFRETKGGVVIKNKKFSFDNEMNVVVAEDIATTPEPGTALANSIVLASDPSMLPPVPIPGKPRRPIKYVVLDDVGIIQDMNGNRVPIMTAVQKTGLQFKPNKKYPVFAEMDDPRDKRVDKYGQPTLDRKKVYVMWDDLQQERTVSQDYFLAANVQLEGGVEFNQAGNTGMAGKDPVLSYSGLVNDKVVDIRAAKKR